MTVESKVRILIAKPGLDGHDRGAKIVARALRDAGFEVIYTGLHQTAEMIAETAIQEDVNGIGVSILSGAHMTQLPALMELLRKAGGEEIVVFAGGIIPPADIEAIKRCGVREVFTPGAATSDIVAWVRENIKPRA